MRAKFPALDLILIESGGDNLAATFSPELADLTIYVIDVAAGDKIPSKGGPGITRSDLLVINKIDLAPHVGASLAVMERDASRMRGARPFVFTNVRAGDGVDAVVEFIEQKGGMIRMNSCEFCICYLTFDQFYAGHLCLMRIIPPFCSMNSTTASTPSPARTLVNTNGRAPRMREASRSITASEAPTCGARSILLMTRRSDRVMPGPPLDGILSPAATSIT